MTDEIRRSVFDALWKARPKDENGLPVALISSLQVWPMVEAVLKATQVEELEVERDASTAALKTIEGALVWDIGAPPRMLKMVKRIGTIVAAALEKAGK